MIRGDEMETSQSESVKMMEDLSCLLDEFNVLKGKIKVFEEKWRIKCGDEISKV